MGVAGFHVKHGDRDRLPFGVDPFDLQLVSVNGFSAICDADCDGSGTARLDVYEVLHQLEGESHREGGYLWVSFFLGRKDGQPGWPPGSLKGERETGPWPVGFGSDGRNNLGGYRASPRSYRRH